MVIILISHRYISLLLMYHICFGDVCNKHQQTVHSRWVLMFLTLMIRGETPTDTLWMEYQCDIIHILLWYYSYIIVMLLWLD